MPTPIAMPQLGETVTEGTVVQWLKHVGDVIEKYDPLVEVSTDKVNAEIPAPVTGVLLEILAQPGQTVPTGATIAVIAESANTPVPPSQPATTSPAATTSSAATTSPRHSPAVRRLARGHDVDLSGVTGTGRNGRITAQDVLGVAKRTVPSTNGAANVVPLSPARRIIAERMTASRQEVPQAWMMVEVDVTAVWRLREENKATFEAQHGVKLTLLPFAMWAVARALRQYPMVNSTFTQEGIRVHPDVNVALAVALKDNLVLPVVRNADHLSVGGLALAAGALIERARRGKLVADDLAGATFTLNNTGAVGSVLSVPILPPGQTAIMTTESVVRRPVVRDDAIAIRSMMNICLTLDHRAIDGAVAGAFLADVKKTLETASCTI